MRYRLWLPAPHPRPLRCRQGDPGSSAPGGDVAPGDGHPWLHGGRLQPLVSDLNNNNNNNNSTSIKVLHFLVEMNCNAHVHCWLFVDCLFVVCCCCCCVQAPLMAAPGQSEDPGGQGSFQGDPAPPPPLRRVVDLGESRLRSKQTNVPVSSSFGFWNTIAPLEKCSSSKKTSQFYLYSP